MKKKRNKKMPQKPKPPAPPPQLTAAAARRILDREPPQRGQRELAAREWLYMATVDRPRGSSETDGDPEKSSTHEIYQCAHRFQMLASQERWHRQGFAAYAQLTPEEETELATLRQELEDYALTKGADQMLETWRKAAERSHR